MVPLYAARIADLGAGDLVQIKCTCGHVMLLTAQMLATAGAAADQKLVDLSARLRCREALRFARHLILGKPLANWDVRQRPSPVEAETAVRRLLRCAQRNRP